MIAKKRFFTITAVLTFITCLIPSATQAAETPANTSNIKEEMTVIEKQLNDEGTSVEDELQAMISEY